MGVSLSRWGAYSGNWSWWWIQVEVTGGSLIMSSRRVTQQLLYFCSSGAWCLYLTCNKWRGSGSFFSSPQDNAIYCTQCCSTLTNPFPCSVGNQYLPSLARHSWLVCIFYQHVILVSANTRQSPQYVLYLLLNETNSWIQGSLGVGCHKESQDIL